MRHKLKELRTSHGLSISEVADKLQIAKSTYAGYEYGRRSIPNDLLPKFAALYNVSTDYLLGLSNDKEGWQSVDDVVTNVAPDIAEEMKKLGATLIQLNAELLDRGMTREELETLLRMMINIQKNKNEPPAPTE